MVCLLTGILQLGDCVFAVGVAVSVFGVHICDGRLGQNLGLGRLGHFDLFGVATAAGNGRKSKPQLIKDGQGRG